MFIPINLSSLSFFLVNFLINWRCNQIHSLQISNQPSSFYHLQDTDNNSGKFEINHIRISRQIEGTSSQLTSTHPSTSLLPEINEISTTEAVIINSTKIKVEKNETRNDKKKIKDSKETLDTFLAGPLIVVGVISLVSLCLFLLYVCKYRSTGSSGVVEPMA